MAAGPWCLEQVHCIPAGYQIISGLFEESMLGWKTDLGSRKHHFLPRQGLRLRYGIERQESFAHFTHRGCGNRLVCVVNVHNHVLRVIGDIVYVSDDIGNNI